MKKQKTEDGGQKTEDRRRRAEDGGQKTEDRRRRAEDGGQKTEDRRRRTEDRGQRTEGRGQRTEGRGFLIATKWFDPFDGSTALTAGKLRAGRVTIRSKVEGRHKRDKRFSHGFHGWTRIRVGFMGLGGDGLGYPKSQSYSKRACAFGLRSLSMLLTLSATLKPRVLYLK